MPEAAVRATPKGPSPVRHAESLLDLLDVRDARARDLFTDAFAAGFYGGRVQDLRRRYFLSRRPLQRRFERAGLPKAQRIVAWARLLHAAEVYAADRALTRAVWDGTYSQYFSFSGAMSRLAGIRPRTWKAQGASLVVLRAALVERWRESRAMAA